MTTLSFYDITIPVWTKALTGLSWALCKTEEHYKSQGRSVDELLGDKLVDDMLPFGTQVALALSHSLGGLTRLQGTGDFIVFNFESFADARKQVADALRTLQAVKPEDLAGAETRQITWDPRGNGGFKFDGASDYLFSMAMPNFWFHTTMAYALMRRNGVPLGKRDFMASGEPPAGLAAA
jgi:uncharacterized protein